MKNIAVVIVTFNRKNLLVECINGVLNQTSPIDKIFIIDNNSSDGTYEYLNSKKILSNELITYKKLNANLGGAGGFHEGMKIAYNEGYQWVWVMDDDVEPEREALFELLKYQSFSKCIHPTKIYTNTNQLMNWDGHFCPKSSLTHKKKNENWRETKLFTTVNYGCFEGMLINRSIIEKIGFPDKRFFIIGDDLIYGYLASKHTPIYYLRDSIFKKKINKETYSYFLRIKRPFQSPFTLYFNARNHFLKKEYLIQDETANIFLINMVLFFKSIKLLIEAVVFFRSKEHIIRCIQGLYDGLTKNYKGQNRFLS